MGKWFGKAWWLLLLSVIGIAAVVWTYCHTSDPKIPHTSALNATLDSRLLIAGTRVVMGAGIAYLLLSIGVRIRRGHWIRNAGPFQADSARSTQEVADSQQELVREAEDAKRQIDDLQARLARSLDAQKGLLGIINSTSPRTWRRVRQRGGQR